MTGVKTVTHAAPSPRPPAGRSPRARGALALATAFATAAAGLVVAPAAQAAVSVDAPIVISEVYGGGGNAGGAFNRDFIELANVSGADAYWTL